MIWSMLLPFFSTIRKYSFLPQPDIGVKWPEFLAAGTKSPLESVLRAENFKAPQSPRRVNRTRSTCLSLW
jgi:hypothetical protein